MVAPARNALLWFGILAVVGLLSLVTPTAQQGGTSDSHSRLHDW